MIRRSRDRSFYLLLPAEGFLQKDARGGMPVEFYTGLLACLAKHGAYSRRSPMPHFGGGRFLPSQLAELFQAAVRTGLQTRPYETSQRSNRYYTAITIMATAEVPSLAIPGSVLGPATKYAPGAGTHIFEGNVVASLMGNVTVTPPAKTPGPAKRLNKITAPTSEELYTITVARLGRKREILPDVNNIVLARVVRLMPKQAIVVIQQVGDTVLQTEWQGVIRVQDVRATEKDKVKIYESFKPGDIVRAQVISLGDQANYYLSTASNELGVIMATSEAGNDMVPVSWKDFKDPETGASELRKVAKPS
ncbi:hypothetical protein LMH87_002789 [Akanthomyces muscarius]|uniref:Uncharacterized protein n=1 Tax=Akanthomyces muscarius TaxID=2231603 RepID=A0A9W8UJL8_AKAMU|nr:hypothetical protein LMH87_002789 [Akanthomyces muscarius]KAJ4148312.1 hypothetical protein LMH87_002789 [Akanthomyces muscarius]